MESLDIMKGALEKKGSHGAIESHGHQQKMGGYLMVIFSWKI